MDGPNRLVDFELSGNWGAGVGFAVVLRNFVSRALAAHWTNRPPTEIDMRMLARKA